MKFSKSFFTLELSLLGCMLLFTSCFREEQCPKLNNNETDTQPTLVISPLENIGSTSDEVAALEEKRGAQVEKKENCVVATKNIDNKKSEITYYFVDNKYAYAIGQWSSPKGVEDFIAAITTKEGGFKEEAAAAKEEKLFSKSKGNSSLVLSLTTVQYEAGEVGSYIFGPKDEEFLSIMRTSDLAEGALLAPLTSEGMPQTFMWRFEKRAQRNLIKDLSKPEKGVFIFDSSNPHIQYVRYWFDSKTQSKLEETGLYFREDNIPSEESIASFLLKNGFAKINLTIEGTKTVMYYKAKEKCVAMYAIEAAKDEADFKPYLQFGFVDLSDQLPKESVDFPMPSMEFNKVTLEEVVENYYKKQPYFVSFTPDKENFGGVLKTNSEDFDTMILASDDTSMEGKYLFCFIFAKDQRVISSPAIPKMLLDMGFKEKKGPALPTYENEELGVSCQIDIMAVSGGYGISFEPMGL